MMKKIVNVCIVVTLIFSIFGCAQTAEDTSVTETENTNAADADTEDAENVSSMDDKEIAAVCEKIKSMDFTASQPQMEIPSEENRLYLEIYLKILKNEIPVANPTGQEVYYQDLWRSGIEFDKLLENKNQREYPYLYYYDDLDGDGKPELAIEQGCVYIFDYEREKDEARILYDEQACYFKKIVGVGQIWYHDGLHASVIRDRLIVLNEDNEWELLLDIEQGTDPKLPYYIVFTDDGKVNVGEENWNEITEPFFEMVENNGLPLKTLEDIFGELLEERKTMSEENYIDEEAFLALKEIYGQIDFNGVFYQGKQSKTNLYKDQFNRFFKGEIPILEKDTGEEVYIYDYQIFKEDIELDTFDLHRYTYYFFDMDGDDNPELCIQVDGNSYFVIKYNEESNQIISWLEMIRTPQFILGTKKLGYSGSNMKALFVLNDDGEWEYGAWFKTEYNEDGFWYMVSLPRYYTQNGRVFNLDDKIKKQGIFDADQHLYYFLVTEEQYNELSEEYNNAVKASGEAVKEVCYTYEELFFD